MRLRDIISEQKSEGAYQPKDVLQFPETMANAREWFRRSALRDGLDPDAADEADVLKDDQLPADRVPGLPGVPGKAGNTCVIEDAEAAGGLTDGGRASLPFLLTEEIPDATPRRFGTSAADLTGNLGSQLRKTDMEQAGSVVVPGHGPVIVGRR